MARFTLVLACGRRWIPFDPPNFPQASEKFAGELGPVAQGFFRGPAHYSGRQGPSTVSFVAFVAASSLACNLHKADAGTRVPQLLEDAMAERTEREVLRHLVEICKDGEHGFRTAAEQVEAPVLKTLFADLAAQRRQFVAELAPHLQRLGGLVDDGTNVGTLHRGWMKLRGFVPGAHDHAIVTEAERGEHAALEAYNDALNGMLPPTVTDLVEEQRDAIRSANERIRTVDMGYE